MLGTLHNLRFYLDFMGDIRQAIELGTFEDLAVRLASRATGAPAAPGALAPVSFDSHDQVRS